QDILREYDHVIDYWVSAPDSGIYDAWNKGLQRATGQWIAFLGADDAYHAGAVRSYVDFIANCADPTLQYVSSRVNLLDEDKVVRTVGKPWTWHVFRRYMDV